MSRFLEEFVASFIELIICFGGIYLLHCIYETIVGMPV